MNSFVRVMAFLLLVIFVSACAVRQIGTSSITVTPTTPFTQEQAMLRARLDSQASSPGGFMQESRIDSISAEQTTLAEADRRIGTVRGENGYGNRQTAESLVWWVRVDGYFRFQGESVAPPSPLYECDWRALVYDASTGQLLEIAYGPTRFLPVAVPTPPPPTRGPAFAVEEHAIADIGGLPESMDENQRIPRDVLQLHMRDRNLPPDQRAAPVNAILNRFGYRLEHDPPRSSYVYLLYRGEQLLLEEITGFEPPTMNARGDDFAFHVWSEKNGDKIVQKDGMKDWQISGIPRTGPVYFGNELIYAQWQDDGAPPDGEVVVKQGEKEIFATPAKFMVADPIKGLWGWNGHWVLEVDGKLFVDGKDQNQALGYDQIFEWRLIHDKPFYFFKQANQIGISYDGQVLPGRYDQVAHYRCCEPAVFNPGATADMVWFHGLRGPTWYYVEAGVFQ